MHKRSLGLTLFGSLAIIVVGTTTLLMFAAAVGLFVF